MAFDVSWRRLVIGAQDGSMRIWNFNNGQVLKELVGWGPVGDAILLSNYEQLLSNGSVSCFLIFHSHVLS
jgi:hypothetical protein